MYISDNLSLAIESYFGNKAVDVKFFIDQPSEERSQEDIALLLSYFSRLKDTDAAVLNDCVGEIKAFLKNLEEKEMCFEACHNLISNNLLFCETINQDDDLPQVCFDSASDEFYFWLDDKQTQVYVTPFFEGTQGIRVQVEFFDKDDISLNLADTTLPVDIDSVPSVKEMVKLFDDNYKEIIEFVDFNRIGCFYSRADSVFQNNSSAIVSEINKILLEEYNGENVDSYEIEVFKESRVGSLYFCLDGAIVYATPFWEDSEGILVSVDETGQSFLIPVKPQNITPFAIARLWVSSLEEIISKIREKDNSIILITEELENFNIGEIASRNVISLFKRSVEKLNEGYEF